MRKLKRLGKPKRKVIRRYRYDVRNEEVLGDLNKGKSVYQLSHKYSCSMNVIRAIRDGTRPEPPPIKKVIPKEDLCSCCGIRPIDKKNGLRFLCDYCFSRRESGAIAVHCEPDF